MVARVTRMAKRRLGELLQAEGLISEQQLKAGLGEQRKSNLFLGEALVKLGYVTEESIAATIAQQFSLPFLSAEQYDVPKEVLEIFPDSLQWEYQFLTLEKIGGVVIIVGAGLMNHDVLSELERICSAKICQYVGTWGNIRKALDVHYKDYKKEHKEELTDLGEMLLSESQGEEAAVSEAEAAGAANVEKAAKAAEGVVGVTGDVLQEALAAVEAQASQSKQKAPAPKGGEEVPEMPPAPKTSKTPETPKAPPPGAVPEKAASAKTAPAAPAAPAVPAAALAKTSGGMAQPVAKSVGRFSSGRRLSAFAGGGSSSEERKEPPAAADKELGKKEPSKKPSLKKGSKSEPAAVKGGLLDFLKK